MARFDSIRKPKKVRAEGPDPDMLSHIRSLGLRGVEEYLDWCSRHGFSRRIDKHWRQRAKERSFSQREIAAARVAQIKQERKNPQRILDKIIGGELTGESVTQPHLQAICRAFAAVAGDRKARFALREVLRRASAGTELLSSQPVIPEFGHQAGNSFIDGLLALSRHFRGKLRPLEDWQPQSHNARRQFASLARHLFAEWPVPPFLDSAWFLGDGPEAQRQQAWFLHIGRGENIRTADLPIPYTKRMAHEFMQAPAELTSLAALRWGQIHALGGNARLAKAVLGTWLGTNFARDDFWTTVLQFFIANPLLDVAQIGPIIDFIQHQKFASEEAVVDGVRELRGPPQPNFTMKGRTPESLLRQVTAWHRTLARVHEPRDEWPASGIAGFLFEEGSAKSANHKIWTIRELTSARALLDEGRAMKHCVGSYASSCARGNSSIWTLEVELPVGQYRVLTIEVQNRSRLIVQARGKCNALPTEKHLSLLRRWGEQAALTLGRHV